MNFVAIKMLVGDRAKYFGIVLGIAFAAMLITQQSSIFVGLMTRTFGFITDTGYPDIWVMDPKVQFIDDTKPMQDTKLYRVRGVEGVQWAVPLYKGILRARLADGTFQNCNVIGIDDASLAAGPPVMVEGTLEDLRKADGVIVDEVGARGRLARPVLDSEGQPTFDEKGQPKTTPLQIGDVLELNDKRAIVVGICRVQRTFQSQPVIYTTYSRATRFAPRERRLMSFICVKIADDTATANTLPTAAQRDARIREIADRIEAETGLLAMPAWDFSWKTVRYFMKFTGIPINFGIAVVLGFLVGTAIAGQTFYQFTADNIKQFGALKAMGTSTIRLFGMICLQALIVGLIGYGLGVGEASGFAVIIKNSELAFRLLPQTLLVTGGAITIICILASSLALIKVIRVEPAIVFK
ncbi:MAG: ABC transporter permease [Phycisphaerales bacterium]|nr:ABC transporter permease [Phycisphaerales bacterium]